MQSRKGIICLVIIMTSAAAFVTACVGHSGTTTTAPMPAERTAPVDPAQAIVDPVADGGLEDLIGYAARVRLLSPSRLRSEYILAQDEHRAAPNAFTLLKLGALVSVRQAPFRDDLQAREFLSTVADGRDSERALRDLASLWLQQLDDRIALERALDDERRQRQTLHRKLEQLKTIEKEIDRRPARPIVPSR